MMLLHRGERRDEKSRMIELMVCSLGLNPRLVAAPRAISDLFMKFEGGRDESIRRRKMKRS